VNNRILETLEFEKVKQLVRQFVVTAQGTEELAKLVPINEPTREINRLVSRNRRWLKSSKVTWGNPYS